MTIIAFLNELSFPAKEASTNALEASVLGLVRVLQSLRRVQPSTALHSPVPLASIPVGDGMWLGQVMATGRSRDEWRFLRGFENRAPYRVGLGETFAMDSEYRYEDKQAEGLGLSHAVNTISVSFANEPWTTPTVALRRIFFSQDGDFDEETVEVKNASAAYHIDLHEDWIRRLPLDSIRDGSELWSRRGEIFPHLRFLPRTEGHICAFKAGEIRFAAASHTLMYLEIAVSRWNVTANPMPTWLTLTSAEAGQRREKFYFDDLAGIQRCFDWHARYTPGAGRIHFWCDRAAGLLTVAHVGEKVPD